MHRTGKAYMPSKSEDNALLLLQADADLLGFMLDQSCPRDAQDIFDISHSVGLDLGLLL